MIVKILLMNVVCLWAYADEVPFTVEYEDLPIMNETEYHHTQPNMTYLRRAATAYPGSSLCLPMSSNKAISIFFWTEGDAVQEGFFQKLLSFIDSNCANARVFRLVMRMTTPKTMWLPNAASPFYQFLAKIQSWGVGMELVLFPYLMESPTRLKWREYAGVKSPLEGVVSFMFRWNAFLSKSGIKNRFKGIVLDYEEHPTWTGSSPMDIAKGTISSLKNNYGNFEFGLTIGYDDVKKFTQFSYADKFYLQIYDLYTPSGVTKTTQSRFYLYRNNPEALVGYMKDLIFTNTIKNAYAANAGKLYAMWSLQNPTSGCIFPNSKGICDPNYELGSWSGGRFNEFIRSVSAAIPVLGSIKHGLYYFGLTPKSWLSR